jgi:hypothetical protein
MCLQSVMLSLSTLRGNLWRWKNCSYKSLVEGFQNFEVKNEFTKNMKMETNDDEKIREEKLL